MLCSATKIRISVQERARTSLQVSRRSMSSVSKYRASSCPWPHLLLIFCSLEPSSHERGNSHNLWHIEKIYVCPFCTGLDRSFKLLNAKRFRRGLSKFHVLL